MCGVRFTIGHRNLLVGEVLFTLQNKIQAVVDLGEGERGHSHRL